MTSTTLGGPGFSGSLRQHWLVKSLAWIALCWVVVFWRLGYLPLLDPDEAHYAQITREMMRAHEFIVPLLDGQPHIDKPVLFHWLQALSFTAFGQNFVPAGTTRAASTAHRTSAAGRDHPPARATDAATEAIAIETASSGRSSRLRPFAS